MDTDLEIFQYNGRRFAVTFTEIELAYDPGYRILNNEKTTFDNCGRSYQVTRRAIVCVVRQAYTGTPYTGIAILHPAEVKKSNPNQGRMMALKRAVQAYVHAEETWEYCTNPYTAMLKAYHIEMLRKYDMKYVTEVVVAKLEKDKAAAMLLAKKAEEKRNRMGAKYAARVNSTLKEEKKEEETELPF